MKKFVYSASLVIVFAVLSALTVLSPSIRLFTMKSSSGLSIFKGRWRVSLQKINGADVFDNNAIGEMAFDGNALGEYAAVFPRTSVQCRMTVNTSVVPHEFDVWYSKPGTVSGRWVGPPDVVGIYHFTNDGRTIIRAYVARGDKRPSDFSGDCSHLQHLDKIE